MRARLPDRQGHAVRDGLRLGFEVAGSGSPSVLLLPTWTIIHSRFWKMQVPYLARHYQVITYDGPGNGRSDRSTDPFRYDPDSYASDAVEVLDTCGVDRAVVVGLSLGAQYGISLAANHPERVAGLVLVGAALPLVPPQPERAAIGAAFHGPAPTKPRGWERYNLAYWHSHYEDFVQFFFEQVLSEPHSTKAIEDAVSWALDAGPEILEVEAARPPAGGGRSSETIDPDAESIDHWAGLLEALACPTLVIHGTEDRIHQHQVGLEAARLAGASMITMEGSGHMPNVREPVRFNLVLRDFIEGVKE